MESLLAIKIKQYPSVVTFEKRVQKKGDKATVLLVPDYDTEDQYFSKTLVFLRKQLEKAEFHLRVDTVRSDRLIIRAEGALFCSDYFPAVFERYHTQHYGVLHCDIKGIGEILHLQEVRNTFLNR
jgi:hypothetical protein